VTESIYKFINGLFNVARFSMISHLLLAHVSNLL